MKQIIPFKKDLPFKTKVSDITSISLERKIEILDGGIVTGTFYITGDYKMNEVLLIGKNFLLICHLILLLILDMILVV